MNTRNKHRHDPRGGIALTNVIIGRDQLYLMGQAEPVLLKWLCRVIEASKSGRPRRCVCCTVALFTQPPAVWWLARTAHNGEPAFISGICHSCAELPREVLEQRVVTSLRDAGAKGLRAIPPAHTTHGVEGRA